jgi:anthranilate phosphoribosyltransferase
MNLLSLDNARPLSLAHHIPPICGIDFIPMGESLGIFQHAIQRVLVVHGQGHWDGVSVADVTHLNNLLDGTGVMRLMRESATQMRRANWDWAHVAVSLANRAGNVSEDV